MFRKPLLGMMISLAFLFGGNSKQIEQKSIDLNKKMIEGNVFYSRYEGNSFYIMAHFKKIDPVELFGEVDYIMMDSPQSNTGSAETVSYKIKNGKLMIYGNDGSMERLSLIMVSPDLWAFAVEEDLTGDGKHFKQKKIDKEIWHLTRPERYPPLEKCKPIDQECIVR